MSYLIILLFLGPLTWRLLTNYTQGVYWAVFLITVFTGNPVLMTGGDLPNFNLQRLILVVLFLAAIKNKQFSENSRAVPFLWVLLVYAVINILPIVFSIDLMMSIKAYLSFTLEIVLFYLIISKSMTTKQVARNVALAGASAFLVVAILAIIERYTGFNPVDAFLPGYVRKEIYQPDILATFPHRILLGTAMAMGWPLALAFAQKGKRRQWLWWIGICLLLLACYFSFSRGPWIGAMFAGIVMFFFAGPAVKRQSIIVLILIAIALMFKPGVLETLTTRAQETADADSFKGQTYQYRWELWGIAWKKISHTPDRTLFGFGQGATEVMKIESELSYSGETSKLWSWDNHYAATMLETGLVGLAAFAVLHFFFLFAIFGMRRAVIGSDKTLHAAIMASIVVILFMMTNVAMFAPQLNYLLWALIAAGLRLGKSGDSEVSHEIKDTR